MSMSLNLMAIRLSKNYVIDVVALPAVIDVLACVSYDFSRVIFSNYVKKPE
tara:strand:+ start:1330 stop:1482 length:153 start_codon:yes stop_codon:yes gene_type:complete